MIIYLIYFIVANIVAKIICSEIENIEKWKKENPNALGEPEYFGGEK